MLHLITGPAGLRAARWHDVQHRSVPETDGLSLVRTPCDYYDQSRERKLLGTRLHAAHELYYV